MRALLWAVMYIVAVAGGIDAYLLAADRYSTGVALLVALAVAVFLATVPTPLYQRAMRAIERRRREALLAAGHDGAPPGERADDVEPAVPVGAAPVAVAPVGGAPVARASTGLLAGPGPDPRLWLGPGPAPLFPREKPRPAQPEPTAPADPPPAGPTPSGEATEGAADDGDALDGRTGPLPRAGADVVAECTEQLAEAERVFGADHPRTFAARLDLAGAYWALGQLDVATAAYEETAADSARVLGPDDPQTLTCTSQLASAYEMDGRLDEAIGLYERTLAARERVLGAGHPDTETSRRDLAIAHAVQANLNRGRPEA